MKKRIENLIDKFKAKSKKFKIVSIVAAVLVFAVLFFAGCKFFGNPIVKIQVISAANEYIDNNIPGMERSRSICKYDMKRDVYYIDFTPAGWSSAFRLEYSKDCRLVKDGYTVEYMYSGYYNSL